MTLIFKSNRILCRRWLPEDFDALYQVYSDPVAARYVDDGQPITQEDCARWFEVTERNYATRGYGMFAFEERSSGQVIGFGGLVHPGGQPEAEVKYSFLQSHWGQGLASEAVPSLLAYGAEEHGLARIIATVAPGNLASQRVLIKSGMTGVQSGADAAEETNLYEWLAPRES